MLRTLARRAAPAARSAALRPAGNTAVRRCLSTHYLVSHEYISMEGDVGTIGITDHAQNQLGDVVYVELPEVGDEFDAGDTFGNVESVKAASDVYMPVSGTASVCSHACAHRHQ